MCERFRKTLLDEVYRVAFRKQVYESIEALQADLDAWIAAYNDVRTHQGRWCFGNRAVARETQGIGEAARRSRPTASDHVHASTHDARPLRSASRRHDGGCEEPPSRR